MVVIYLSPGVTFGSFLGSRLLPGEDFQGCPSSRASDMRPGLIGSDHRGSLSFSG